MATINHKRIPGLDQFLHENQTWDRALDFYLQENSYLKTRLSKIIDTTTGKEFIEQAEHFQNSFIHNDECIKDLQSDIIYLQKQLKAAISGKVVDEANMMQQQNKLSNEIAYFEKDFAQQRSAFNQYLVSLLT